MLACRMPASRRCWAPWHRRHRRNTFSTAISAISTRVSANCNAASRRTVAQHPWRGCALPIAFESFQVRPLPGPFIDCEGQKAIDDDARDVDSQTSSGAAAMVLEADAAISRGRGRERRPGQADSAEFSPFSAFFRTRPRPAYRVGGLPVFLVPPSATARPAGRRPRPGWNASKMQRRVGERTTNSARDARPPIRHLHLNPWATAVKRPAAIVRRSRGSLRRRRVFRQAFEHAAYRRRGQSSRRLLLTVMGVPPSLCRYPGHALVATPDSMSPNWRSARPPQAREQEQSPVTRHKNPRNKIDELSDIANHPAFLRRCAGASTSSTASPS